MTRIATRGQEVHHPFWGCRVQRAGKNPFVASTWREKHSCRCGREIDRAASIPRRNPTQASTQRLTTGGKPAVHAVPGRQIDRTILTP